MRFAREIITVASRVRGAQVGRGSYISARAVLREHGRIRIGDNSTIGRWVEINPQGGSIDIGDNCSVHNLVVLYGAGNITIGDDCRVANGAVMVAFNHSFTDSTTPIRTQTIEARGIRLDGDVWVGARALILDGVTVGRGSVIGAGAVVTKDIPPYSVAVGNPARVVAGRGLRATTNDH